MPVHPKNLLVLLVLMLFADIASAQQCDINNDGVVDITDVRQILDARNLTVPPANPALDIDGNGVISVNDGRQCAAQCSLPRCAEPPPVGTITADILRGGNPSGSDRGVESAAGNLVADAQLWSTSGNGAQIAFVNPGSIRSDLVFAQSGVEGDGVVTYREAFVFQPFGNTLVTFPMTGSQIVDVLEEQCQPAGSSRPFLHLGVSDGFTYDLATTIVAGVCTSIAVSNIKLNGVALDATTSYLVTANSFLANGGDGFVTFQTSGGGAGLEGGTDLEAIVSYFNAFSPVAPPATDRVNELPPGPAPIVVTTADDSGPGSLREALSLIGNGGRITFDPSLAGATISLVSGQLNIDRPLTIDASSAPGLRVSGSSISRVFDIDAGIAVSISDLTITDGAAAPQGGGILNRGVLNLDRVVVTGNAEISGGPASFNFGGGGIYNDQSSTLNLTDSTISDNMSVNQPGGGIYGFFNSTINIIRSTVSGNVGGDIAGGLRSLGTVNVVNSTFSGNTSTFWHGGGIFHTDGILTITNSTFTDNLAPAGTASGVVVATFGAPASLTLTNSVMAGTGGALACAIEGGGAATITSGGSNVISDGSCNPSASDQSFADALLGPLSDNGGPTLTHALGVGSPAIDAAVAGACPATDQRGIARVPATCDVGAFEQVP